MSTGLVTILLAFKYREKEGRAVVLVAEGVHPQIRLPLAALDGAVAGVLRGIEVAGEAAPGVHDDLTVLGGGKDVLVGGEESGELGAADVAWGRGSLDGGGIGTASGSGFWDKRMSPWVLRFLLDGKG